MQTPAFHKAKSFRNKDIDLKDIPNILPLLSQTEQERLLMELEHLQKLKNQQLGQKKFLSFVNQAWPTFVSGRHHAKMAAAFEKVAAGLCKRLIINMPPRHTKSEFASYLLPAWYLGRFPDRKIIQTSNTAELAVGFGRKVRNLVDSEIYQHIFPGVGLQADSKAAGRWNTNQGGTYFAVGVSGTVTGMGADVLIIDDPHSEQEAKQAETSPEIFDKVYEWYTSGPRQRLQPGGAIVIVMCMTGDTLVMMADGTQKSLREVRCGDVVATFDNGVLSTSRVNNWRSSGFDSIYKVQTQSGIILRANERHPFLVENNGEQKWVRLKDLKTGDTLVSLKDVVDRRGQKQSRVNVHHANPQTATTENTQIPHVWRLDGTVSGKVKRVLWKVVKGISTVTAYVSSIITRAIGRQEKVGRHLKSEGGIGLKVGMALPLSSMTQWLKNAVIVVMSAVNRQANKILEHIGTANCASTTATIPGGFADCYVMTATSLSGMEKRQIYSREQQRTSDFTVDPIVSITPDGVEEVFDVEVDRTENFIANGVVSHNTRWSKRDLTGRVLKEAAQRDGEEWEVIEFPALLPSGQPLWPEFWPLEELQALQRELPNPKWMAQYQQNPTSEATAIIKREWWRTWEDTAPPRCDFILMAWDTAFEKTNRSDYSALTTWGVFYHPDARGKEQANIILLNAFRERMEFPRLKQVAMDQYKDWKPDGIIIEKKASGSPLIYELRAAGIPVQEFTPVKGNDKISRLNAVSDIFASGRVWAPNTHWAEEVIDEVASFPSGEHDDYVDSVSLAMMRFRKGGYIGTAMDEEDEPRYFKQRRTAGYY